MSKSWSGQSRPRGFFFDWPINEVERIKPPSRISRIHENRDAYTITVLANAQKSRCARVVQLKWCSGMPLAQGRNVGRTHMPTLTTKDGTQIYFKDWGTGQPIVFSHGWPLTADDWDGQMLFFGQYGYRVIAHDRRGHGRSSQTWDGNTSRRSTTGSSPGRAWPTSAGGWTRCIYGRSAIRRPGSQPTCRGGRPGWPTGSGRAGRGSPSS